MSCRIADAMNTYKYALTVVRDKGYKIFALPDTREESLGETGRSKRAGLHCQ